MQTPSRIDPRWCLSGFGLFGLQNSPGIKIFASPPGAIMEEIKPDDKLPRSPIDARDIPDAGVPRSMAPPPP
jgi:hypothetical protein